MQSFIRKQKNYECKEKIIAKNEIAVPAFLSLCVQVYRVCAVRENVA